MLCNMYRHICMFILACLHRQLRHCRLRLYIYICIYTYIHTHMHICIHIHSHTRGRLNAFKRIKQRRYGLVYTHSYMITCTQCRRHQRTRSQRITWWGYGHRHVRGLGRRHRNDGRHRKRSWIRSHDYCRRRFRGGQGHLGELRGPWYVHCFRVRIRHRH